MPGRGYLPLDKTGADLLFQIISHRYEREVIFLATNRIFNRWPKIFNNDQARKNFQFHLELKGNPLAFDWRRF